MSALLAELRKEASGVHSVYFTRKRAFIADGKKYRDAETSSIERLEKEIEALRRGLGAVLPGDVLTLSQEFPGRLSDATNPWTGGQVALAREILSRVEPNKPLHATALRNAARER